MATQKIFQAILKICPKSFLFFFQPQIDFILEQTFSEKLVLDTIILANFFFSLKIFFQKCWKFLLILNDVFMYALINVW